MSNGLEIAGLLSKLKSKVKRCPCCLESSTFNFVGEHMYIPSMSEDTGLPTIAGTCTNCGYILLFDVRVLEASGKG